MKCFSIKIIEAKQLTAPYELGDILFTLMEQKVISGFEYIGDFIRITQSKNCNLDVLFAIDDLSQSKQVQRLTDSQRRTNSAKKRKN